VCYCCKVLLKVEGIFDKSEGSPIIGNWEFHEVTLYLYTFCTYHKLILKLKWLWNQISYCWYLKHKFVSIESKI
jgi:hypothetical protein